MDIHNSIHSSNAHCLLHRLHAQCYGKCAGGQAMTLPLRTVRASAPRRTAAWRWGVGNQAGRAGWGRPRTLIQAWGAGTQARTAGRGSRTTNPSVCVMDEFRRGRPGEWFIATEDIVTNLKCQPASFSYHRPPLQVGCYLFYVACYLKKKNQQIGFPLCLLLQSAFFF